MQEIRRALEVGVVIENCIQSGQPQPKRCFLVFDTSQKNVGHIFFKTRYPTSCIFLTPPPPLQLLISSNKGAAAEVMHSMRTILLANIFPRT